MLYVLVIIGTAAMMSIDFKTKGDCELAALQIEDRIDATWRPGRRVLVCVKKGD